MNDTSHPALIGALTTTAPKTYNFSPGPTSLPQSVEERIAQSFQTGKLTSLALSHRSPEFVKILSTTKAKIRDVMSVPDNYEILFTHGGGHGQFAAVPLNLCTSSDDVATYVINGTWSERGRDEAKRYCTVNTIDAKGENGQYTTFPALDEANIDSRSKFIYLCSNETVNGIELYRLPNLPESLRHIPLVVDASSDFSTKPIDWEGANVGILFACASKNIGHPGATVTIVRKDLMGQASPLCPGVFHYKTNAQSDNLWNTPATFNIEVIGWVMDWLIEQGGVEACEQRSKAKAQCLYDIIDSVPEVYQTPVEPKSLRSRMNVPFSVMNGDQKKTDSFLIEAWEAGIVGLRTLTPFGVGEYLRASLYNGVSLAQANVLASFMKDFAARQK
ncbi:3-phosphoserine/phosphohydroxythreonine transaminase [Alteromonas sp. 1_MG-2023]|uniref:3-phosphoserine/phosphohydroxythreonine transaminase n=1 Tax=Alteromonas sp. 1_MG-2023 TaxID=3062669 RepID=UPI0026E42637|nr:3-phosphoserine/phosphohydroxythreonine transaminase [Alteromonas sp. 1_MG-2023]MDO6566666.1 3-phosphoserine/phosphohydroxythreonine transaminase [Alteromonas sp. 1_MG-2023]